MGNFLRGAQIQIVLIWFSYVVVGILMLLLTDALLLGKLQADSKLERKCVDVRAIIKSFQGKGDGIRGDHSIYFQLKVCQASTYLC